MSADPVVSLLVPFEEMKKQARAFYGSLGCSVWEKDIVLAVQSLTLPNYARKFNNNKEFSQNGKRVIYCNSSLATVGDAFIDTYILRRVFSAEKSAKELSDILHGSNVNGKPGLSTNGTMNAFGEELLGGHLYSVNDIPVGDEKCNEKKAKAYATSFEAVLGFLCLIDYDAALRQLERFYKDKIL